MIIDTKHYSGQRKKVETSKGLFEFPLQYEKAYCLQAYYMVDFKKAASKLSGTGLVPARFINGKALVALAFFEYLESSAGVYNEVGLAITVLPKNSSSRIFPAYEFLKKTTDRTLGFHILDLPVTTDLANSLGREVWGYPKFVTEIPLDFSRNFEGKVMDPDCGEEIFSFSTKIGMGLIVPGVDLTLYSNHENSIIKTIVDVYAPMKTSFNPKAQLRLGSSQHKMVENLRDLDLQNNRPLIIQSTKSFQSFLNLGEKVASQKDLSCEYV